MTSQRHMFFRAVALSPELIVTCVIVSVFLVFPALGDWVDEGIKSVESTYLLAPAGGLVAWTVGMCMLMLFPGRHEKIFVGWRHYKSFRKSAIAGIIYAAFGCLLVVIGALSRSHFSYSSLCVVLGYGLALVSPLTMLNAYLVVRAILLGEE